MLKKAQSAIELVIVVAAVLFFFIGFLIAVQINTADKTKENKNLVTKEVALTIQNEINLASQSHDGYYRRFTIPRKIINSEYGVSIQGGLVYINTTDGLHALALPIPEIEGDICPGENTITKESGSILITPEENCD